MRPIQKENKLSTDKNIHKWTTTYYIIDGEFFIEKRDRKWIWTMAFPFRNGFKYSKRVSAI